MLLRFLDGSVFPEFTGEPVVNNRKGYCMANAHISNNYIGMVVMPIMRWNEIKKVQRISRQRDIVNDGYAYLGDIIESW